MQLKRKLPKVNRGLAARILENAEAENECKDVDDIETKKKSKKKKGLGSDVFKDERFAAMFENKVSQSDYLVLLLFVKFIIIIFFIFIFSVLMVLFMMSSNIVVTFH